MNNIYNFFLDNFTSFSKKHIFSRDFYNLTKDDKYEISKETFSDIAKFLVDNNEVDCNVDSLHKEYFDNIMVHYMEMLG